MTRAIVDLIDRQEPALPLLREWVSSAVGRSEILLPTDPLRSDTLVRLQVTTRSMLGAVAFETGGVMAADGLLRLLGSGADRSLLHANAAAGLFDGDGAPDASVVADDVLGGLFALNGGRFGPGRRGEVFHLAADDTAWISLGSGYGDFVSWCLTGDVDAFYGPLATLDAYARRPRVEIDTAFSFYPFLWSAEAKRRPVDARTIDADESLRLRIDLCGFAVD